MPQTWCCDDILTGSESTQSEPCVLDADARGSFGERGAAFGRPFAGHCYASLSWASMPIPVIAEIGSTSGVV